MRVPAEYFSNVAKPAPSDHHYHQYHRHEQGLVAPTMATVSIQDNHNHHRRHVLLDTPNGLYASVGGHHNRRGGIDRIGGVIEPATTTSPAPPPPPPPADDSASNRNNSALPPLVPDFLADPVLNRTYARGRFLGKGGFAWCYGLTDIKTHEKFAVKVSSKTQLADERQRLKVWREIKIHQELRHKHIVRLYSAFEDNENIYMVMELCTMGSLITVMKKRKTLSECEVRYYMYHLLTGVHYLHEDASVLHRDLKLGNMLLTELMELKIADFGLATDMDGNGCSRNSQVCGTPNYISPEVLRKESHSRASEAWAIGCIMFALLVGKPPFETHSIETTYSMIRQCQYSYPPDLHVNASARNLIGLLLHRNPAKRPNAMDALAHEFFSMAIPISLPDSCCYYPPNASELTFFNPSISSKLSPAFVASTYQFQNEDTSPQLFSVGTNEALTAGYAGYGNGHATTYAAAIEDRNSGGLCVGGILKTYSPGCGTTPPPSTRISSTTNGNGHHRAGGGDVAAAFANIRNENCVGSVASGPYYSSSSPSTSAPNSNSTVCTLPPVNACPLDARGALAFGPEGEAALRRWLRGVYHAISDVLYVLPCDTQNAYQCAPVSSNSSSSNGNIIYVTKWIDYSNRYGFGCQFNNNGVSVIQNDWTRLCLSPDRRYCRRWHVDRNSVTSVNGSDVFDLTAPNNVVDGLPVHIMKHFVDYMDTNLVTGGYSESNVPVTSAVPFIVSWRRLPDHLLVVLSDGTFQVNFTDCHAKVILSRLYSYPNQAQPEVALTFINETRLARTCALKNAVGNLVDGGTLHRMRQLLADHVLTPPQQQQGRLVVES